MVQAIQWVQWVTNKTAKHKRILPKSHDKEYKIQVGFKLRSLLHCHLSFLNFLFPKLNFKNRGESTWKLKITFSNVGGIFSGNILEYQLLINIWMDEGKFHNLRFNPCTSVAEIQERKNSSVGETLILFLIFCIRIV